MIYNIEKIRKHRDNPYLKKILEYYKEEYERHYRNTPVAVLPYSEYKQVYITGNRSSFERYYFDRRKRFFLLQALCLFDDQYIEEFEDLISAICEEYTWILPIHCVNLETKTFDYSEIDLFCSETAMYLAETLYVFKDKLCAEICARVKNRLKERIIDNYEKRSFKYETFASNWASVCGCGIGATYLFAFPERFDAVKDRLLGQFENYLKSIDDEGYCYEGVAYWQYGFGFFSLFFSIYKSFGYTLPKFVESEKVINTVKYITRANLQGDCFLPFADGGGDHFNMALYIMYIVKDLFGNDYTLPDKRTIEKSMFVYTSEALFLHTVNGIIDFGVEGRDTQELYYYKKAQVFIGKKSKYSFVAKGGNNDELHNHNDVGSFQIVRNGKRVIVDIGAGEYTCDYFVFTEEGRYNDKIFVCNSASHSVPIVNGCLQKPGKEYFGTVNAVSDCSFDLDIQNAYAEKIEKLNVKYVLYDDYVAVKYACKGIKNIVFRFITPYEPKKENGVLLIDGMQFVCPDIGNIKLNRHAYSNGGETECSVYMIDYEVIDSDFEIEFKFVM